MKKRGKGRPTSTAYGEYVKNYKKLSDDYQMGKQYSRYMFNKIYNPNKSVFGYNPKNVAKNQRSGYNYEEAIRTDKYSPPDAQYKTYLKTRKKYIEHGYGVDPVMSEKEFRNLYDQAKKRGDTTGSIGANFAKQDLSYTYANAKAFKASLRKKVNDAYDFANKIDDLEARAKFLHSQKELFALNDKYRTIKKIMETPVRQNMFFEFTGNGVYSREEFEGVYPHEGN